jgi:hypothetical protein
MVDVPAATAVTSPVELTVATPEALEVHEPPLVPPVRVNWLEPLLQIDWIPVNEPEDGAAVTVTVLVGTEQPPVTV